MRSVNEVCDELRFIAKYESKRNYNDINVGDLLCEAAAMLEMLNIVHVDSVPRDTVFGRITTSPDAMVNFLLNSVIMSPCDIICDGKCFAIGSLNKTKQQQCKEKILAFLNQKITRVSDG